MNTPRPQSRPALQTVQGRCINRLIQSTPATPESGPRGANRETKKLINKIKDLGGKLRMETSGNFETSPLASKFRSFHEVSYRSFLSNLLIPGRSSEVSAKTPSPRAREHCRLPRVLRLLPAGVLGVLTDWYKSQGSGWFLGVAA